ncbi:MAG: hypothetical protein ACJ79K_05375 [Gemmatimonadaceae bacterium]
MSTSLDATRTVRTGAASALTFLILRSGRNRLRAQVARLKNVRYVLGVLFLVAYYAFLLRPDRLLGVRRPGAGAPPAAVLGSSGLMISALMLTILVAYWWTFGTKLSAIALSRAESRQLLPAPLSRNELILFKLARASIATFISAMILAIISRRGSVALPFPLRVVSYMVMFGTFQLHQLGATLTRSGGKPVGEKLGRRGWIIGGVVVAVMAIALGTSLAAVWPRLGGTSDFGDGIDRVREALSSMPAILVIAPARAVVAPLGAASVGEWLRVFPIAVAIWLLHVPWILLNRTPFEEAAVAAGERREALRAAMRARRASGGRGIGALIAARAALGKKTWVARRTWLPLPPTGPAWMAITWKNFIPTVRQLRWATLAYTLIGIAAIGIMVTWISYQNTADLARSILIARNTLAGVGVAIAVLWTIIGPLYTRNDFRSDLPYLRLLRTFPLDSGSLVGAEIAASTALIFAFQIICLVLALVLPGGERVPLIGQRTLIFFALLLALFTLDVLSVTVRNAVALFFPGWVKLGSEGGGFEVIGQNLLGTIGSSLLLILLLIVPAALAGGVLYTIHSLPTAISGRIVFALIAFVAAIAAELWFLFRWLGSIYDNIDAGEVLDAA